MFSIPTGRYLAGLFRRQKRLLARFVITSLGQAFLTASTIFLIKEFLSGVLEDSEGLSATVAGHFGPEAALWVVAMLLVGAYVGGAVLQYDNQVVQQRVVKILELGTMERLIRHLLGLSVPFFDRHSHGDLVTAVKKDVSELRNVILGITKMFLNGVVALGLMLAALTLSPGLTFLGMVAVPLAAIPILHIAKRTAAHSKSVRTSGFALFDSILEMLRGIRVIKAFEGENREAGKAIRTGRRHFDQLIEMVRIRAMSAVVLQSIAGLGLVIVVVAGGFEVMAGTLEWPALMAFLLALRAIHGPLNAINTSFSLIHLNWASVERIRELLDTRPDVREIAGAVALGHVPEEIVFDNVGLVLGAKPVLDGLSFRVRKGETIGIVGPSGAGKSTLLNMIARFYDPTHGSVCFGRHDLRELKTSALYGSLALVTQEPFLFSASVLSNIECGRPGSTPIEVEEAARAAGIHDEILRLPDGYETVVGVGGQQVSLGQAQRINIARSLLKNAPILLLDEATASLDSLSEARVQQALGRLMEGRTTFVVAHRLSTLKHADRILVIEDGALVGVGPHAELIRTCPLYQRLWEAQHPLGKQPELTLRSNTTPPRDERKALAL